MWVPTPGPAQDSASACTAQAWGIGTVQNIDW